MESWDHDLVYVEGGNVIEEVHICRGGGDPIEFIEPTIPSSTEDYIQHMGEYGYQFAGTYPCRAGFMLVMKRPHVSADAPPKLTGDELEM